MENLISPANIGAIIGGLALNALLSVALLFVIYKVRGINKSFSDCFDDMKIALMWTFFVPIMPKLVALMIGFTTDKKTVS